MPEGNLALAEATVYLALAPKSNRLYTAYDQVRGDIAATRNEPVPLQIRNAVTGLMKQSGYGKGYRYVHDHMEDDDEQGEGMRAKLNEDLPPSLRGRRYYRPTGRGFEKELRRRIAAWGNVPKPLD
jgi:putative ATPase